MNKFTLSIFAFTLSGCVDVGLVGIHPELRTTYVNGYKDDVESCLYSAAITQKMSLVADEPLPNETSRYDLQNSDDENVAWVDVSQLNNRQTEVSFYYAPHTPDIHKAVMAILSECRDVLH